eukprot:3121630-Alexandrium_andersonii.AAC.1
MRENALARSGLPCGGNCTQDGRTRSGELWGTLTESLTIESLSRCILEYAVAGTKPLGTRWSVTRR